MKSRCVLLSVVLGLHTLVSAQTLVSTHKTITQDTTVAAVQRNSLTSQSVTASGQAVFSSKTGYVRILLSNDSGYDLLVYESTPLLAVDGIDNFSGVSIEAVDIPANLALTKVRVEIKNAELKNLSVDVSATNPSRSQQQQARTDRIALMNSNLRAQNALWTAGETSVSQMSYQEKKKMFGGKVLDRQGFEYYKDGIFELHSDSVVPTQHTTRGNASFVSSFDWRNRHGRNWITPAKNQNFPQECGSCTAFACVGNADAYTNLYYNQLLNLDLSEQALYCHSGPFGGSYKYDYIRDFGIVDEACLEYVAELFPYCFDSICLDPRENIKVGGYSMYDFADKTFDELKTLVIKSPVHISIGANWNHAMVLVGYKTIEMGDEIDGYGIIPAGHHLIGSDAWLVKNSYGTDWGVNGFGYITLNFYLPYTDIVSFEGNSVTSLNYTDANIICEDRDGDGYYYWGIGQKPAHCPACAPHEPDGDDSNPNLGPMDEYGNCAAITPMVVDFIDQSVSMSRPVTSCGDLNVQNVTIIRGATLTLQAAGNIYVKDVAVTGNSKLILEAAGEVIFTGDLDLDVGTEVEIR